MRAGVFVAFAGVLAVTLALLAALVARWLGVDVNLWTSTLTALVIGVFVALVLLGPRKGNDLEPPEVEGGFEVVKARERDEVHQEDERK